MAFFSAGAYEVRTTIVGECGQRACAEASEGWPIGERCKQAVPKESPQLSLGVWDDEPLGS